MSQLGPAFLHRPLPVFDFRTVGRAVAWIIDGLRFWIPATFRTTGWQAETNHYQFSRGGDIAALGVIERSWAGERRLYAKTVGDELLPSSVIIDDALVFRTSLNLPREAMRDLRRAVELRLNELSPLPPQEVASSVIGARPADGNRINVDIAIVRKTTLANIREHQALQPVAKIIAANEGGEPFSFLNNQDTGGPHRPKWLLAIAALWVSILLLGISLQHRSAMHAQALDTYQDDLRQAIDAARAENERLHNLQVAAPPSLPGDYAFAEIVSAIKALPEGSVIEYVAVQNHTVQLRALAPAGLDWSDVQYSAHVTPSDRDGYEAVTLTKATTPSGGAES